MNPFYAVTTPRLGLDFAAMVPDMQRIYLEHGVTTCQDGATAPTWPRCWWASPAPAC